MSAWWYTPNGTPSGTPKGTPNGTPRPNTPTLWCPLHCNPFNSSFRSHLNFGQLYFHQFWQTYYFSFASKGLWAKHFRCHHFIRAHPKYHMKVIFAVKLAENIFDKFSNPIHSPPIVWPRGWIHGTSENSWRRLKSNFQQFLSSQFWWWCWL